MLRKWTALIFLPSRGRYPVRGLIHTLADYLDGRTFQIKIDATISRTGQIQAGCPQGSNLSPILYNIYTHDFPTSPRVKICLFADDAAIINQANTPREVRTNLQKYLMKLKKWLKLWRISINTSKSRAIIFKKGPFKNNLQPLRLFGNSITWYDNIEYLGVVLDKRFTLKTHQDKITCKFKNRLQALHKLLYNRSKLSMNTKRRIYLQYLLPIITYASPVWGSAATFHINKLQILQNRVLRLILNAPTYVKRIHLHRDLKIPALSSRIHLIKWAETILLERRQTKSVGRWNSRSTFLRSDWPRPFARREVGVSHSLIESSQNTILRIILDAHWYMRNEDIRKSCNIPTIRQSIRNIAINFFSNIDGHDNPTIKAISKYPTYPFIRKPRDILVDPNFN
ncbi:probable RNA-directed DNA polymerase from transposon BS [Trichonephila clavipes]|nr:probable RNA-directed DNA polymerase from transposon BS [Trichonephila clavipes]